MITKDMNSILKAIRLESQKKNNKGKPKLISEDVLETEDFNFSPINPLNRVGDSGELLLASSRKDNTEKYLIKHEYCDCAANEFVYSKLARAMGLHIPESRLFRISENESRDCFKSGYTIGAVYLDVKDPDPSYEKIRNCSSNWEEYYSFMALYYFFLESDSFEILLTDEDLIYRVDTADAFLLSEFFLSQAGLDVDTPSGNLQEIMKKTLMENHQKKDFWQYVDFYKKMEENIEKYGKESRKGFLCPFYEIQGISQIYIDDFLNTLCYFYPDFIGDCYKLFIGAAQKKAKSFLDSLV